MARLPHQMIHAHSARTSNGRRSINRSHTHVGKDFVQGHTQKRKTSPVHFDEVGKVRQFQLLLTGHRPR